MKIFSGVRSLEAKITISPRVNCVRAGVDECVVVFFNLEHSIAIALTHFGGTPTDRCNRSRCFFFEKKLNSFSPSVFGFCVAVSVSVSALFAFTFRPDLVGKLISL